MKESTEKKIVEPSTYLRLAKRFGVSQNYVSMINNGWRTPVKGKGLKVRRALEQLKEESNG